MLYLSAALLLSLAALTVNGSPMPKARAGSHQVTVSRRRRDCFKSDR